VLEVLVVNDAKEAKMTEQLQVKVLWKLGNIELQYEGNESFLITELPKLFKNFLKYISLVLKMGNLNLLNSYRNRKAKYKISQQRRVGC
jgi:hypothetical protein